MTETYVELNHHEVRGRGVRIIVCNRSCESQSPRLPDGALQQNTLQTRTSRVTALVLY
jgi:hypothetical protein